MAITLASRYLPHIDYKLDLQLVQISPCLGVGGQWGWESFEEPAYGTYGDPARLFPYKNNYCW